VDFRRTTSADDAVFAQEGNGQAGTETEALQHLAHARRRKRALRGYWGPGLVHGSLPARPTTPSPDEWIGTKRVDEFPLPYDPLRVEELFRLLVVS